MLFAVARALAAQRNPPVAVPAARVELITYAVDGGIAGTMRLTLTRGGHAIYEGPTPKRRVRGSERHHAGAPRRASSGQLCQALGLVRVGLRRRRPKRDRHLPRQDSQDPLERSAGATARHHDPGVDYSSRVTIVADRHSRRLRVGTKMARRQPRRTHRLGPLRSSLEIGVASAAAGTTTGACVGWPANRRGLVRKGGSGEPPQKQGATRNCRYPSNSSPVSTGGDVPFSVG